MVSGNTWAIGMPPARRARSFLVTRAWKLECVDEVRGTIKLLFSSCWGSLYSGFLGCHRRSHLGVSRQFSGASWCISRACRHPELLGIRCGIDLAGFSVRVVWIGVRGISGDTPQRREVWVSARVAADVKAQKRRSRPKTRKIRCRIGSSRPGCWRI